MLLSTFEQYLKFFDFNKDQFKVSKFLFSFYFDCLNDLYFRQLLLSHIYFYKFFFLSIDLSIRFIYLFCDFSRLLAFEVGRNDCIMKLKLLQYPLKSFTWFPCLGLHLDFNYWFLGIIIWFCYSLLILSACFLSKTSSFLSVF